MPSVHRPVATVARLDAAFPGRPFTLADAYAVGLTREQIRAAVARGLVHRLGRGVFATATALADRAPDDVMTLRVRAALLALPGAVASHASAGLLHRLPDPVPRPSGSRWAGAVEVTRPGARPRVSAGLRVHGSPLDPAHVVRVNGVAATSLARTALDLCRRSDLRGALVVADAAVRRLVTDRIPRWDDIRDGCHDAGLAGTARNALDAVLREQSGWPGCRGAQWAVERADAGAESPLESWSRAEFLLAGLPRPEAGVPVPGDDGCEYWVDLDWAEFGVVGEADGAGKYDHPRALYQEKLRQDAIERRGRRVVRWTGPELHRSPQVVVDRVERALRERGWTGPRTPWLGR